MGKSLVREPGTERAKTSVASSRIDKLIQSISVLIVEDNQYMRKVIRNILVNLGVDLLYGLINPRIRHAH